MKLTGKTLSTLSICLPFTAFTITTIATREAKVAGSTASSSGKRSETKHVIVQTPVSQIMVNGWLAFPPKQFYLRPGLVQGQPPFLKMLHAANCPNMQNQTTQHAQTQPISKKRARRRGTDETHCEPLCTARCRTALRGSAASRSHAAVTLDGVCLTSEPIASTLGLKLKA